MDIITREKYNHLTECAAHQSRLWANANERWWYHEMAANIVRQIAEAKPELDVLEIGSHGVQIVEGSTTVDVSNSVWPYTVRPDFDFDIRTAWPFSNKQFDVCIALRVWQHLGEDQAFAFREACRVATNAIIAAPPQYANGYGITFATMQRWAEREERHIAAMRHSCPTNTAVYWIAPC